MLTLAASPPLSPHPSFSARHIAAAVSDMGCLGPWKCLQERFWLWEGLVVSRAFSEPASSPLRPQGGPELGPFPCERYWRGFNRQLLCECRQAGKKEANQHVLAQGETGGCKGKRCGGQESGPHMSVTQCLDADMDL